MNTINQDIEPATTKSAYSAGLWSAFWPLLAAVCTFMAASAEFNYHHRTGLFNGGLALVASSFNMILSRWLAEKTAGTNSRLARLSLGTLISLGLAAFFATFALLMAVFKDRIRWGGLTIWEDGVTNMVLLLAVAFLGLAAICARVQWSNTRFTTAAATTAITAFLFGPTLTGQSFDAGVAPDKQELFFKYSLPRMLSGTDDVFLRVVSSPNSDPEGQFVCVEQRTRSVLMFGHRSAGVNSLDQEDWSPEHVRHWKAQCQAETKAALTSGQAIESALHDNQPALFFARMRADPVTYRERLLAADIRELPEPLKSRLTLLLPAENRWSYRPFDVALAVGDRDAITVTMPPLEELLPHQRQVLFGLGIANLVPSKDNSRDVPDAEPAQEHIDATLFRDRLGDLYRNFSGGYSEFDYFMANRHCDLAYAKFLLSRNIQPTTQHILHLLSTISYSQYPLTPVYWSSKTGRFGRFVYAHPSLGVPDEQQLGQCMALTRFYAETVRDFNDSHPSIVDEHDPGVPAQSAYWAVYKLAGAAVVEYVTRNSMRRDEDFKYEDRDIVGDPALMFNAAAEILKRQPPSFEHYCAWANTANFWLMSVKESNPNMVAALTAIPNDWQKTKAVYRASPTECKLRELFAFVNEFGTFESARDFVNAAMKQKGVPCRANLVVTESDHGQRTEKELYLRCTIESIPWRKSPDA